MLTDEEQEILAHEKPDDESPAKRELEKSPPKLPPLKDLDEPYHPKPAPMPENHEMSGYGMLLVLLLVILVQIYAIRQLVVYNHTPYSLVAVILAPVAPSG